MGRYCPLWSWLHHEKIWCPYHGKRRCKYPSIFFPACIRRETQISFSNSILDLISELPPILTPCQRSTKFITKLVSPKCYFSKLPSSILPFLMSISEISHNFQN